MDDSIQCWSNLLIEYFKIWCSNSSNRTRRLEIIHWFNHLHFFDPQHSFRRKLWTSTNLSLESYLPASECCWRGKFIKMRIRNLQSLLVCSIIIWKSSLTWDEWISGWRSWLASLILSCVWVLTFTRHMWWWVFWYIRNPKIESSWIRCWRRRRWICKNVSWKTLRIPNIWRPFVAARHSQRTAWKGGKNAGWLATWDCPLRTDSPSLKSLESFIYLTSVCKSWILAVRSRIVPCSGKPILNLFPGPEKLNSNHVNNWKHGQILNFRRKKWRNNSSDGDFFRNILS